MCTIAGWIGEIPDEIKNSMIDNITIRGNDGIGIASYLDGNIFIKRDVTEKQELYNLPLLNDTGVCIFARAIPSNERYTKTPESSIQPLVHSELKTIIMHNGTISNDKELATKYEIDYNDIRVDSEILLKLYELGELSFKELEGSFATSILDFKNSGLILARNFQPLYYIADTSFICWFSLPEMIPKYYRNYIQELSPYSFKMFSFDFRDNIFSYIKYPESSILDNENQNNVIILYSSGLDSLVTTRLYQVLGYRVKLLHFNYGQQAKDVEKFLTKKVAEKLDIDYEIIDVSNIFPRLFNSRLFQKDNEEDIGLKDAETTLSYVPARNLILTSLAIGIAEQEKFKTITLGLNIDDGGAYPDNTVEFIRKLEQVVPFSINWNNKIQIRAPLVNLTKKNIIEIGQTIQAPFELSCSCYFPEINTLSSRIKICRKCGPDLLREQAFKACGIEDPLITRKETEITESYISPDKIPYWDSIRYFI